MVSYQTKKQIIEKAMQNQKIAFENEDIVITEGDIVKDIKAKLIADGLTEKQAITTMYRDMGGSQ